MNSVRIEPMGPAGRPALRRLFQLYLHDLSAFEPTSPGADGRFDEGPYLDLYWTQEDRHPFLIKAGDRLAGFVLVREIESGARQIAEFFVLRGERGRGVGRAAALETFERYPGRWEVAQLRDNLPAQAFWRRVVGEYTEGRYLERATDSPPGGVMQLFTTI